MVKGKYGVIVVLVVAAGVLVRLRFSETEETRVRRQFDRLSEWVSKDSEETILTAARRSRSIASLFADDCIVVAEDPSLAGAYGREGIVSRVTEVRSTFTRLRLRFYDLRVGIAVPDSAGAVFTARATGRTRYEEWIDETREVACSLVKTDGVWHFARLEVVKVLEK